MNEDARLGSQVLEMAGRLAAVEKQARKTPPGTLLVEIRKVEQAQLAVEGLRADLRGLLEDHARVRSLLGRGDRGLSDEYLKICAAAGESPSRSAAALAQTSRSSRMDEGRRPDKH